MRLLDQTRELQNKALHLTNAHGSMGAFAGERQRYAGASAWRAK